MGFVFDFKQANSAGKMLGTEAAESQCPVVGLFLI
jgi:hypothetical protein